MLPSNDPDRIQITFGDHRLVANAGLILPITLAQHLGLRELVDSHVDLGDAPGRANPGDKMLTLVASAPAFAGAGSGWRRLHRRRRRGAHRRDGSRHRLRGQGAIHPGDLSAQLPVGARPPAGPGEPGVAGPGLVDWGGTQRRAPDHRSELHHLHPHLLLESGLARSPFLTHHPWCRRQLPSLRWIRVK